jgi:hypothetical protein
MRTLTNVPIGINGKIHYADVMVHGTVSEKSEWILDEFKKLPLYLQEKMLKDLGILKKMPILQISTTYKNKLSNYIIKKGKMQCEKFRTYRKTDRNAKKEV